MEAVAVIPAFNESQVIGSVVREAASQVDLVLVVDDGSSDDTAAEAKAAGASVLVHSLQRGPGRATATGLEAALRLGARFVVTLDGDGQHRPHEIPGLLAPLKAGEADMVLGCRILERQQMPWIRRLGNRVANLWTWLLFGVMVSDSQSGFRAFTREAVEKLPLDARGYEFCSETLGAASRLGLRIQEAPISAVYTEYSQSKGQSNSTAVKTLVKIGRESLR